MRQVSASTQARLEAGELVLRDFVWIGARRRTDGSLAERGWWSDVGTVQAQVVDAQDIVQTRTYIGNGDLMSVSSIPLTIGFTAQEVSIQLSLVSQAVEEVIREWNAQRAPVEIHRGLLDPVSMLLPEPAVQRFVGFVDNVEIPTPAEGGEGAITLTCANLSQELLRSNAAKRSDADQRLRNSSDGFYRHAHVVKNWQITWFDEDSA